MFELGKGMWCVDCHLFQDRSAVVGPPLAAQSISGAHNAILCEAVCGHPVLSQYAPALQREGGDHVDTLATQ